MSKLLCIYHANCADGFAAAWAVHRRFGDDVEFIAANYGDDPPDCFWVEATDPVKGKVRGLYCEALRGRDVLIVDFSYPINTLRAMASQARSVLVLDHHKTAQADLAELPGLIRESGYIPPFEEWRDELSPNLKLAAIFDMERSGSGLTWDYLHPGTARPRIIDLVEDRDLWRFGHQYTRRFHAVAASHGYDLENFELWDDWYCFADMVENPGPGSSTDPWIDLMGQGDAILRYEAKLVEGIISGTRRTMKIAGYTVPVACCPGALASEVGNLLCGPNNVDNGPWAMRDGVSVVVPYFSATYYDGADGRRHFSLRSPPEGVDVGAIAKQKAAYFNTTDDYDFADADIGTWTGGGHAHAAGFDAPIGWEGE